MKKHLIEIAYEYAKENFKKNSFSFKELFDALAKNNSDIKNNASDLYIELLQDIRFISLGKQKWSLRENFTLAEINKITSSMFGLDEYHEEDADKYMSNVEKKEQAKEKTEDFTEFMDVEDDDSTGVDSFSGGGEDSEDSDDVISKSDDFDNEDDSDDKDVDLDDIDDEKDDEDEIDEDLE